MCDRLVAYKAASQLQHRTEHRQRGGRRVAIVAKLMVQCELLKVVRSTTGQVKLNRLILENLRETELLVVMSTNGREPVDIPLW